jgi:hypothetical protein
VILFWGQILYVREDSTCLIHILTSGFGSNSHIFVKNFLGIGNMPPPYPAKNPLGSHWVRSGFPCFGSKVILPWVFPRDFWHLKGVLPCFWVLSGCVLGESDYSKGVETCACISPIPTRVDARVALAGQPPPPPPPPYFNDTFYPCLKKKTRKFGFFMGGFF